MSCSTLSVSISFYDNCVNNVNSLFCYGSNLHEKLKVTTDKHVYLYDEKPTDEAKYKILILEIDAISRDFELSITDSIFNITNPKKLKLVLTRALVKIQDYSNKCQEILQSFDNTDSTIRKLPRYRFYQRMENLLKSNQKLIERNLNICDKIGKEQLASEPTVLKSFSLISAQSKLSKITDFYSGLKNQNLICPETKLNAFRQIFKNEDPEIPVKWLGNISELKYTISCLHSMKLINDPKKHIWKITAKCFVDKNGNQYDWQKFRNLKEPVNAEILKQIVGHLI